MKRKRSAGSPCFNRKVAVSCQRQLRPRNRNVFGIDQQIASITASPPPELVGRRIALARRRQPTTATSNTPATSSTDAPATTVRRRYSPTSPAATSSGGRVHPYRSTGRTRLRRQARRRHRSGATAVTLVPAMAPTAAHVTMLQRSPSYILTLPARDPIADFLRRTLPEHAAHGVVRWKNILVSLGIFQLARRAPDFTKRLIKGGAAKQLPPGYDVDTHFSRATTPGISASASFPTPTCSSPSPPAAPPSPPENQDLHRHRHPPQVRRKIGRHHRLRHRPADARPRRRSPLRRRRQSIPATASSTE